MVCDHTPGRAARSASGWIRCVAMRLFLALAALLVAVPASAIIPRQGAEYIAGQGVWFRVFAPNATSVAVAGEWNGWSATATPMTKDTSNSVWYVFVPLSAGVDRYKKYKFVINGGTLWQKDPYSLRVENSGGDANSIIEDLGNYQWSANEANWQSGAHVPGITQMVMYEMHLGSFLYRNSGIPYGYAQAFNNFANYKLDYLADLGINAVKIMPIFEFPGDQSWGYNPAFFLALESSYGTSYEFQRMVDMAHQRGIAVIVDVCYNHAGPDDIPHYWNFDGGFVNTLGGNGNYFYTDWRARTPWGNTEPNWGLFHVRDMFIDSAKMLALDYHVDGVRVDSTVTMRKDADDGFDWNGSDDPSGWSMLQYLNNELRPLKGGKFVTVAEDINGNQWITRNTNDQNGAGFMAQWVHSPINDVVNQFDDNNRSMATVATALGGAMGYNYGFHELVKYHSSHDMLDKRNNHWRLPNRIGDPSQWYTKKRSKLANAITILGPGTPMIFMGDEFYATGQWDDNPENHLDWLGLEGNRPYWEFMRTMIQLKKRRGSLQTNNLEIPVQDENMKIIAWKRWDNNGDIIVTVANFRANQQTRSIPFPEDGTWYELVNSDAGVFGGDNVGNGGQINVSGGAANVTLGSYSVIAFAKAKTAILPGLARNPTPGNGAINMALNLDLKWNWAAGAASYNLFLGTDANAVANAGGASPEFKGNTTNTQWSLSGLSATTTYYWRVDPVNGDGVSKGTVWSFTTGFPNSGVNGRASWTPSDLAINQEVTVRYIGTGGALAGSPAMFLHWSYNNWVGPVTDTPMTSAGTDIWTATVTIPAAASQFDFVFTANPADGTKYDNNGGADWHLPVAGALPKVTWEPTSPATGNAFTITYHADRGPLTGASQMYIHIGVNGWTSVSHPAMTSAGAGTQTWTYTMNLVPGVTVVDFVFADGLETGATTKWDNNNNQDWHVPVSTGVTTAWGVSNTSLSPITSAGINPLPWSFDLWNAGTGTLNYTLAKQPVGVGGTTTWFNLDSASGSSTGAANKKTFNVAFDVTGLAAGTYNGQIIATDTDGKLAVQTINISLTVNPQNRLVVSPASGIVINWPATGSTADGVFTVNNGVNGTMSFNVEVVDPVSHPWLTVASSNFSAGGASGPPTPVTLRANVTALPRQDYSAQVRITAPGALDSPITIPVTLRSSGSAGWTIR